jgi:predicted O-methyltransferase YrrM
VTNKVEIHPESDWTKPCDWCPRPGHWHSTDPQSTEIEVSELVGSFVRALQPEYVIETGTCLGQTAACIALALCQNGHGRLDTLEPDRERAEFSRRRAAALMVDPPITVHEVDSLDFTPTGPICFAWLDSRMELRVPEFERYRPWMGSGTVVGFHDTAPHHGGWADDLLSLPGTRAISLRTPRGVTFLEVL